jgi:DNA-binding GntR family transcriptional regulator
MKFKQAPDAQPRLAIDVYEQILSAIINGQVTPGERLIQEQIAAEINVSRTPVREALLRLEQEGILEQTSRKGFSIRNIADQEVHAIYGAREAIEGYAAYLVAGDGGAEKLAKIRSSVDAEQAPGERSLEEEFTLNRTIHRVIVEQTGNPVLLDMFDNIWNRGLSLWLFAATRAGHAKPDPDAHLDLYQAIADGNPAAAHAAMIGHVRDGLALHLKKD